MHETGDHPHLLLMLEDLSRTRIDMASHRLQKSGSHGTDWSHAIPSHSSFLLAVCENSSNTPVVQSRPSSDVKLAHGIPTLSVSSQYSLEAGPRLNSPKNLLSLTCGWNGRTGYMTGVLYSSKPPTGLSCRRCHFLSGISPNLVLSEDIEMSENRFAKLGRRLRELLALCSRLLSIESSSGVAMLISRCSGLLLTRSVSLLLGSLRSGWSCFLDPFVFLCLLPPSLDLEAPLDLDELVDFEALLLEDFEVRDDFADVVEATELRDDLLSSRRESWSKVLIACNRDVLDSDIRD